MRDLGFVDDSVDSNLGTPVTKPDFLALRQELLNLKFAPPMYAAKAEKGLRAI